MDIENIDLTKAVGVVQYLQRTPFAATTADLLVGGGANFTYRLHLVSAYQGQKTLVLKHAEGYAALAKHIEIDAARLVITVLQ